MMNSYSKHLSYFYNCALDKSNIKNSKAYKKAKDQNSFLNLFLSILFSFVLVSGVAFGLKIIEDNLTINQENNGLLGAKVAIAAELKESAEILQKSHNHINIKAGKDFTLVVKIKNTGQTEWTKDSIYLKSLPSSRKFKHALWPSLYRSAYLQKNLSPEEKGTLAVAMKAPNKLGTYSGDFVLVNNKNIMIPGGKINIKMSVVKDPTDVLKKITKTDPTSPSTTTKKTEQQLSPDTKEFTPNVKNKNVCTLKLNFDYPLNTATAENSGNNSYPQLDNVACVGEYAIEENGPDIEVGIFNTHDPIKITNKKAWQVYNKDGLLLASVRPGKTLEFKRLPAKNKYVFEFNNLMVYSRSDLILRNITDEGVFEILSYEDRPSWNREINYNLFKGTLKIKYYAKKDRVWLTETLPLEKYLKGLKETSEGNPEEYQKAMTIAARTYALYHVNKFEVKQSFFDLYNDQRDQVYKGYQAELVMPTQAKLTEETKGIIGTHSDQVIVAYYSARSGGSTIDYKSIPYLKARKTPYTAGKGLYGHGIGLDQQDAKARAKKDGWTYDQLLKYYYNEIDLEKIY